MHGPEYHSQCSSAISCDRAAKLPTLEVELNVQLKLTHVSSDVDRSGNFLLLSIAQTRLESASNFSASIEELNQKLGVPPVDIVIVDSANALASFLEPTLHRWVVDNVVLDQLIDVFERVFRVNKSIALPLLPPQLHTTKMLLWTDTSRKA